MIIWELIKDAAAAESIIAFCAIVTTISVIVAGRMGYAIVKQHVADSKKKTEELMALNNRLVAMDNDMMQMNLMIVEELSLVKKTQAIHQERIQRNSDRLDGHSRKFEKITR